MTGRFGYLVVLYLCAMVAAAAPGADVKKDVNNKGIKVSLGDRTAQVRSVYGNPDTVYKEKIRNKDGEITKGEKEYWQYPRQGLSFQFRNNILSEIDIGKRYRGSVEGIHIGDSREVVREKMGAPDYESNDHKALSYYIYRGHWPKRVVMQVRLDDNDKVRRINLRHRL